MERVAGVYISYPFCSQKCTFCNFASGVLPRVVESAYPAALLREIEETVLPWTPETVYLGGGTPSAMPPDVLRGILSAIPGAPWREATLEAAPGSISAARADQWIASGVNRISLGTQSFIRQELAITGRRHTAEIAASDVATLRSAGLDNINLDLIAGLPSQTAESWSRSLDWIERLAPPHVSVYMLEIDEDSRLGKEMLFGGVRYGAGDAPDEDLTADLYEMAVTRLATMGVLRYEISNFARPGYESVHNMKYWRREPYVGFGSDAHSFDGNRRWANVESPQEYVRLSPNARVENSVADASEERFLVGLRLSEGVRLEDQDWTVHQELIKRLTSSGLADLDKTELRLRLTSRGFLVSNEILQEFLSA